MKLVRVWFDIIITIFQQISSSVIRISFSTLKLFAVQDGMATYLAVTSVLLHIFTSQVGTTARFPSSKLIKNIYFSSELKCTYQQIMKLFPSTSKFV